VEVLDLVLAETLTRWWAVHKMMLQAWEDTTASLQTQFLPDIRVTSEGEGSDTALPLPSFDGSSDLWEHLDRCEVHWNAWAIPTQ